MLATAKQAAKRFIVFPLKLSARRLFTTEVRGRPRITGSSASRRAFFTGAGRSGRVRFDPTAGNLWFVRPAAPLPLNGRGEGKSASCTPPAYEALSCNALTCP